MDSLIALLFAGFLIGALGTLIGAGGGFILVPLLLITQPDFSPEVITGMSMAVVAANAISGSIAYARSGRIDYKAGLLFAFFTIPGSVLGVYTTKYIPKSAFNIFFGLLLIVLAILLFLKKQVAVVDSSVFPQGKNWKQHLIIDKMNVAHQYSYNQTKGIVISLIVGYLSPLLGIGGGIIHVPALVSWLHFPVYIATATSHFILAIMAAVSVIVHIINGNYNDPHILRMVIYLSVGAVAGAQLGALLSHKIRGHIIIRALAVCLGIVGIRILFINL
jgi:hypothetical protein